MTTIHPSVTQVMTRLEILKIMYKRMMCLRIGTRRVESEAIKIVKERLSGPTGHHLLLRDVNDDQQSVTQDERVSQELELERKCWRDQPLVLKLVKLRLKEVKEKQSRARKIVDECLKEATAVMDKKEVRELWKEVKEEKRLVWEESQPRHQRKVDHMRRVTSDCTRHSDCRDLDRIRSVKMKEWLEATAKPKDDHDDTRRSLLRVLAGDKPGEQQGRLQGDTGRSLLRVLAGDEPGEQQCRLHDDTRGSLMRVLAEDQPGEQQCRLQDETRGSLLRVLAEDQPGEQQCKLQDETRGSLLRILAEDQPGEQQGGLHGRQSFRTGEEDLAGLQEEEKILVAKCKRFNKNLGNGQKPSTTDEVITFGDVSLDQDEVDLLNLGPGFMVVSDLTKEDMQVESTVTLTKMRWGRMGKNLENMTDQEIAKEEKMQTAEDIENEEANDAMEMEARDVISSDGSEVGMGRMRATDMKNNRNVKMPAPAPARVEANYNTRAGLWEQEHARYVKAECKPKGAQKKSNLSLSQQLALERLKKRVAKVEIIVLEADKGKRFVIVDEATYLAMSHDHIEKDRIVTPEEVRRSQREMSSTSKVLATILGLGRDQSDKNYARCHDNAGSAAEDAPNLNLLPKVHKDPSPLGHPQLRPVVAAATGLTSRPGDILADLITPLVHLQTP